MRMMPGVRRYRIAAERAAREWLSRLLAALPIVLFVTVAESNPVRDLPYPYAHIITFASDADGMHPWYYGRFHGIINEKLGLHISDSIWPDGANQYRAEEHGILADHVDGSFLFRSFLRRNDAGSEDSFDSVFTTLLRQWHRGNIDHFHGWSLDYTFELRQQFDLPLAGGSALARITPLSEQARANLLFRRPYDNFRLYFSGQLPADLRIGLRDGAGRMAFANSATVARGREVQFQRSDESSIVELVLSVDAADGIRIEPGFDSSDVVSAELHATSCKEGCEARLKRIERDNWSRRTASAQAKVLAGLGIRPVHTTDHGGYTLAQAFNGSVKRKLDVEDDIIVRDTHGRALDPSSHAYHLDILKDLGLLSATPYNLSDNRRAPLVLSMAPFEMVPSERHGFHNFKRNLLNIPGWQSEDELVRKMTEVQPLLPPEDIKPFYCSGIYLCQSLGQGQFTGLLIAAGLAGVASDQQVRNLWYMHFGTNVTFVKRAVARAMPISLTNLRWWRSLADYSYDFFGLIPLRQRVWVPSVATLSRYMAMKAEVGAHVAVDQETSRLVVGRWKDRLTGRLIPEPGTGTRDLHGLTVFVPDSTRAKVFVDGEEATTFTRNPADQTGRQSITIVGDNAPAPIIGRAPLDERGTAEVEDFEVVFPDGDRRELQLRKTGSSDQARLGFKPKQLNLWNTSHLHVDIQISPAEGGAARGFFVELLMADDQRISARSAACGEGSAGATWSLADPLPGERTTATLSTHMLRWSAPAADLPRDQFSPALPIGRVKQVSVGLCGARAGDILQISRIAALRPNGNGMAADRSVLLAGKVSLLESAPVAGAAIELRYEDGTVRRTVSDSRGHYQFVGVPSDQIVGVSAHSRGRSCSAVQGGRFEVLRDEAEIDIDFAKCANEAKLPKR